MSRGKPQDVTVGMKTQKIRRGLRERKNSKVLKKSFARLMVGAALSRSNFSAMF
jgi:hypothetical protein